MIRRTVVVVAAVLVLAGCQGEPEVRTADPTPSPVASSSAVVSETAAPETAEAFIRRLIASDTQMQNTGQSDSYRALLFGCEPCLETADQVDQFYAAGGSIRIQGQRVRAIRALGGQTYEVDVDAGPTVFTRSRGASEEMFPGGPTTYKLTLRRSAGVWRIAGSTRLSN